MSKSSKKNFRRAFLDWHSRHPYVDCVRTYRAVLRARNVRLAAVLSAPYESIERELHVLLFGFGIAAAGIAAAQLLETATKGE